MRTFSETTAARILLFIILVLAATLRFLHLDASSLWWDEFITLGIARLPFNDLLHTLASAGPSDIGVELFPPLYHLLVHTVLQAAHDDATLRSISVLCGTLSLAVLFALAKALFNHRVGIFAALLGALSVFQIHYSRELRPYSLFLLLSLLSLLLVHKALATGRKRFWVLYCLATTAMFYCSYLASATLAAQGLYVLLLLTRGLVHGEITRRRALLTAASFGLAQGITALAYLPWVSAHLFLLKALRQGQHAQGISFSFLWNTLQEFGAYAAPARGVPILPLAGLALVGLAAGLKKKNRLAYALPALWAIMPLVSFLFVGTSLEITSRYLFSLYYALVISAALGIDWIVSRAFALIGANGNRLPYLRMGIGLLLCIVASTFNIDSLSDYYRRETSYYKELADYLVWKRNNVPYLLTTDNRNLKLIADWYLPGIHQRFDTFSAAGYKRTHLIGRTDLSTNSQLPFHATLLTKIQDQAVYALGIVNTSPVILFPDLSGTASFHEDYMALGMYANCEEARNLAPMPSLGVLGHYDFTQDGYVLYRFVVPEGTRLNAAQLRLRLDYRGGTGLACDSKITVLAGDEEKALSVVDVVDRTAFEEQSDDTTQERVRNRQSITRTLMFDRPIGQGRELLVKIHYDRVRQPALIELAGLDLEARLSGIPKTPGPARMAFDQAAKNSSISRWRPGVALMDADTIHAFSADDARNATTEDSTWNPAADLTPFLAEHPGAEPVMTIAFPEGAPAFYLYDPGLTKPFVSLTERSSARVALGAAPVSEFKTLKLEGALHHPRFLYDGKRLDIPVEAPPGSQLLINAGGEGVLRFEPSFTGDDDVLSVFQDAAGAKKNTGESCLSCVGSAPCQLTMRFKSEFPMKSLRIASYPRIFADKEGGNSIGISVSTNGMDFAPVDRLASQGTGLWEGLMIRRVSMVRFKTPAREVFVRFALSGSGAQLWSPVDKRMRLEAVLDTTAFNPVAISDREFPIVLEDNGGAPLGMLLLHGLAPYLHRQQYDF